MMRVTAKDGVCARMGMAGMAVLALALCVAPVVRAEGVAFPASRVGVCSWSWATNMTTILEQMDTMGVKHMQLSLVPWVKPLGGIEYAASLRETFGKGETGDVFASISNRIAKGEITVLSTMISFPFDCWTSFAAISNSNGIVCNIATNDTVGEIVSEADPLGLAAWVVNSNLVEQAAALTCQLRVEYITTEVGYLDKVMMDHGSNANENCNIGMERLYAAHRLCAKHGVKLLFESGQYSGARTMELVNMYTNRYANAPFENAYGITINDIKVNYDVANHLIYGNDDPTNAFVVLRERVPQIHIKDTYEDLDARTEKCGYAGDVKWGTGDVSVKYATLAFLKKEGFTGNLLVEHEWGDDRVGDINAALKAILLANNDDPEDHWINPDAMTGATADERCGQALKAQGFSPVVSGQLADASLYTDFTDWANEHNLEPDNLISKRGVILAAAYGADCVPAKEDVMLSIANLTIDKDGTMAFDVAATADAFGSVANANLLKASLAVEGAVEMNASAFNSNLLDFEFGAVTLGGISISAAPKKVAGASPVQFFVRATAE